MVVLKVYEGGVLSRRRYGLQLVDGFVFAEGLTAGRRDKRETLEAHWLAVSREFL